MSYACLRLDPGTVTTITLARPEKLNALNGPLLDELVAALGEVRGSEARCLLITGEGRGFCSGADLSEGGSLPEDLGLEIERRYNPLIEALFDLPIPVVSAVNGVAAGAGASLALAADIVIAARSASFVVAFSSIGLVPDSGASWLLPRLVGRARALELMLLGEPVSAEKALDWGLIARVADDAALMTDANALATRLAERPTRSLGLIRRMARDADTLSLKDALHAEREAQREAGRTEDFRAAIMAFAMKQPPKFNGR